MRIKKYKLLIFAIILSLIAPLSVYGVASVPVPSQAERQMQSETEFLVALDPNFAGEVLAGQTELFTIGGDESDADSAVIDSVGGPATAEATAEAAAKPAAPHVGKGGVKGKKIPNGLLKKASNGKEAHIKNLERYKERRIGNEPVLICVEAENKDKMHEAMEYVSMCEGVLYTEPLAYYYTDEFDDPRAPEQWALSLIDAFDVWDGNDNLPSVTIAFVDTGLRLSHEDLAASIVPGYDFFDADQDPSDMNGHGTHVAGIAASINNNQKGIASPAGGAKILPVRVLGPNGKGDGVQVANGIYYAADRGAQIINVSFGSTTSSIAVKNAVEYAQAKGCLIVASAGNDYAKNSIQYPAALDGVIIASSLAANSNYVVVESDFSNYSPEYAYRTIHAPGSGILSTDFSGNSSYSIKNGTSMAAPYISGMAAALLAKGDFTGSLYDELLRETVSIPRYYISGSNIIADPNGAYMHVLNDNGNMDTYKNQVFEVRFDGSGSPIPSTQYVNFGERVTKPETDPALFGYNFLGWKRTGENQYYDFSRPVLTSFTINATWEIINKYKITVQSDGNGYAFADAPEALEDAQVAAIATPNIGYRFKEWQIVSGAPIFSGTGLNDNPISFTVPKGAVNLRAVFEPLSTVGASIDLSFVPAGAASNDDASVIYLSDKAGKKVYSIDTKTFDQKSVSFDLAPDSMFYKDGKLYVALCGHYRGHTIDENEQYGAYAVIDCASFSTAAQYEIETDPYGIVVSSADNVYISSGSGQLTTIYGYDQDGKVITQGRINPRSPIGYNPVLDKIYAITTDTSPRSMSAYPILPDGKFDDGDDNPTSYDWPYHGNFSSTSDFRITPDGDYIFNSAGYVLQCKNDPSEDMIKTRNLSSGYVDIAFDLPNNVFYTSMANKNIYSYSYDTFLPQNSYSAYSGAPQRIFVNSEDIIALTKEAKNTYRVEQITKHAIHDRSHTVEVLQDGNGAAAANVSAAEGGERITLLAVPDYGSVFKNWEVVSGGASLSFEFEPLTAFTMPEGDVTLKAVFEQAESLPINGATLSFIPADAVSDDEGAFIYLSDKVRKRVYRVDTSTYKQEYLSFNFMPESMCYKDGLLYVSLCEQEHSSYWNDESQRGEFAVIDCGPFAVKSRYRIDIDPYDIVVSGDNTVYISSGSGHWTSIYGYDPGQNGANIAKGQIRQKSTIDYNAALNKIYAITTDMSAQNMSAYVLLSDGSFFDRGGDSGTYTNWNYNGNFPSAANFKVSPDGKYIFNGIGYILHCSADLNIDMIKYMDLENGFNDIAFSFSDESAEYIYYIAPDNDRREVQSYDYNSNTPLDTYYAKYGNPERIFIAGDGVVALTKTENDVYYIEWAKEGYDNLTLGGSVSITGTAQFGRPLTADVSGLTTAPGASLGSLNYQWARGPYNIPGATGAEYTPVLEDISQFLTVTVSASNLTGEKTSDPTAAVIKADGPDAPEPPTMASKTTDSITLDVIPGAEYMLAAGDNWGGPGGAWQGSVLFDGLSPDTSYTFYARIQETATHAESEISAISEPFTTDSGPVDPVDATIDIAAIEGVAPPMAGAAPVTAITETEQYTGAVTWSGNPAEFAYSTQYTATITLAPKAGYTLIGIEADFFTVEGATQVKNTADSGVVTADFPETETLGDDGDGDGDGDGDDGGGGTGGGDDGGGDTGGGDTGGGDDGGDTGGGDTGGGDDGGDTGGGDDGGDTGGGDDGGDTGGGDDTGDTGDDTGGKTTDNTGKTDNNKPDGSGGGSGGGGGAGAGAGGVMNTLGAADTSYNAIDDADDSAVKKAAQKIKNKTAGGGRAQNTAFSVNTLVAGVGEGIPFTDVPAYEWYVDDVMWAYRNKLMNGTNTDPMQFSPDAELTRGMLVTILYRQSGGLEVGGGNPFIDVDEGLWYADAVKWAAYNGIVTGIGDGKFAPDAPISRQDLAVILIRYMAYLKANLDVTAEFIIYADAGDIADYAMEAIQTLNKFGIINGVGTDGSGKTIIDPGGKATRAQVAAILHRFLDICYNEQ